MTSCLKCHEPLLADREKFCSDACEDAYHNPRAARRSRRPLYPRRPLRDPRPRRERSRRIT
jgi:hypothetical protein